MFPQPSSGNVEVSGTTIHSTIPYVPHLRIEVRDGSVDAGNIEPCKGESRIYLAWYRPCQQRDDKTKALIIHAVAFSTPQIICGFRQDCRELRATERRLWRDHILRASLQEAEATRVDLMFEQRPQEIPVPITPGSHQDPRDRTLCLVCRLLCQRFFFSDRAVEREVVRYVGHLGVSVFLRRKTEVEKGVEVDPSSQAPQISWTMYRTDGRQDALVCAGYLREE